MAGDKIYVAYLGAFERPRCVQLSSVTVRLIQSRAPDDVPVNVRQTLEDWVTARVVSPPAMVRAMELPAMDLLEMSAAAFWLEFLPGPLFADAIAEMSIVPLPLPALARLISRTPLQRKVEQTPTEEDVQARAAMLLELCTAQTQSSVGSQVKAILTRPQEGGKGTHRRKQLADLTALVDASEDDALGLFFGFYGAGLLTIGTVQAELPSDSIKRRHFAAIEALISPRSELASTLHLMSREKRGELYDQWIVTAKSPGDTSAALSALDMYFVLHFDVEPARVRSSAWEFAGLASPRILWSHEQAGILGAVDRCARTTVVAEVAKCLAELGKHKSFRPSDVMYATLGDVHDYEGGHVVLDVRKHHGFPGQKTEAAAHALEFKDATNEIPFFAGYSAACANRGKAWGEPLWGNTWEEARRNFRDAWALLSQLAKGFTGDPTASIYSYRHSWFSTRLEAALLPHGTALDRRLMQRIAHEGGHVDVTTSLTWYFHLPMAPVRACADRALESLLTSTLAANWSSLTRDAIYHRVARAKSSNATPRVDALREGLQLAGFAQITDKFPCQPMAGMPFTPAGVKFTDVLSAVTYVDAHREWWEAADAGGQLNDFELRVARERQLLLAQHKDVVVAANLAQEKLDPLRRYLRDHGTSRLVRDACSEWARSPFEGCIDVTRHESLLVWLRLLQASGTRMSRVVIRMVEPSEQDFEAMTDRFIAATGMSPRIETVPPGYSTRPSAYLQLSSKDVPANETVPSGAVHMNGFCSLLTVARIRLCLLAADEQLMGEDHDDA